MVEHNGSASQSWRSHIASGAAWKLEVASPGNCARARTHGRHGTAAASAGGIVITSSGVSLIENVEAAILPHPVTGFDVVAFVVSPRASLLAAADAPEAHGTICLEGTQWVRIAGSVEVMVVDNEGRREFRDHVLQAQGRTGFGGLVDGEADVIVIIHPEHLEPRRAPVRTARRAQRQPVLIGAGR